MKFRKEIIEKKKIRQSDGNPAGSDHAACRHSVYCGGSRCCGRYKNGTAYAQDAEGFVYQIPKGATTKKGCTIYMYTDQENFRYISGKM